MAIVDLIQSLAAHDVELIIVGGVAALLQGAPVNTIDLDIVYARSPANIDRLLQTLVGLCAVYRALCDLGGIKAVCVRLESGPLVVTDAITPPGCKQELIIGATNADGRVGWLAPTSSPGFRSNRGLGFRICRTQHPRSAPR